MHKTFQISTAVVSVNEFINHKANDGHVTINTAMDYNYYRTAFAAGTPQGEQLPEHFYFAPMDKVVNRTLTRMEYRLAKQRYAAETDYGY